MAAAGPVLPAATVSRCTRTALRLARMRARAAAAPSFGSVSDEWANVLNPGPPVRGWAVSACAPSFEPIDLLSMNRSGRLYCRSRHNFDAPPVH